MTRINWSRGLRSSRSWAMSTTEKPRCSTTSSAPMSCPAKRVESRNTSAPTASRRTVAPIAFVDTPGHEAFTEMRARGANVTDIAVLVIAADDGIMPQTEEAISHAKAAGVPIVVALNKIDLPGADANRVMTQMTEHNLTPSEWGGDVEVVPTSAITGEGMDELLETILTIADLHEYRANPNRDAVGTCLEAEQEGGRGVIAKLIVKNGTLNVGDVVLCGAAYGRVKAMYDTLRPNVRVKAAGPSTPVNITGSRYRPRKRAICSLCCRTSARLARSPPRARTSRVSNRCRPPRSRSPSRIPTPLGRRPLVRQRMRKLSR